jgi:AraC family transcriptional regulator
VYIINQLLGHGASLDLNAKATNSRGEFVLNVVVGGGRGCVLKTDAPVAGIWIPLRGRVQLGSGVEAVLQAGEARVTEADARLHAVGRGNAVWVALLGTLPAWRQVLHGELGVPSLEAVLLPARHAASRDLRHHAVALARAAINGDADAATEAVIDRIVALQAGFADSISRCPGRTYAQRRQVFMRLQRVRNYLSSNCHLDIDNDSLARMANYSPWHFIRAFRAAYEETPHAFLVRQRLERARRLLRASPLAIAEIALESGFENRSAFSRLFRQRFGTTAGAVRREVNGRVLASGSY